MTKKDAITQLWDEKWERMSYEIGDNDGAFSSNTMEDFEALETLVWVANGRKVYKAMASCLLNLFRECDPTHHWVEGEDLKAYNKMKKRMEKLAKAIGEEL